MTSRHYLTVTTQPEKKEEAASLKNCLVFADRYLLFLSLIVTMSKDLRHFSIEKMSHAITYLTLKVLARKITSELQTCLPSQVHHLLSIESLIVAPAKSTHAKEMSEAKNKLSQHLTQLLSMFGTKKVADCYKNVQVSFPELFCPSSDLSPIYRLD